MAALPPHMSHAQLPSAASTPQNLSAAYDEASTTSHASSSRHASTSAAGTASAGVQTRVQFQPLSMADALARSGQDQLRALDQLLAERNKYCLESSKLSTENMRLWNLMKRLRRENEDLKNNSNQRNSPASIASGASMTPGSVAPSSTIVGTPSSFAAPDSGFVGTTPSTNLAGLPLGLSSSSTAPALVYTTNTPPLSSHEGLSGLQSSASSQGAFQQPAHYDSGLSATGHSTAEEGSEPRASLSASEAQGPSSATSASHYAGGHAGSETGGIGVVSPKEGPPTPQHLSIMQQRAAVQAQRLAQIQQQQQQYGDRDRPTSLESQDFEAVEDHSIPASSARGSGEMGLRSRGGIPPSPLVLQSSAFASERSPQLGSAESPRSSFSPRLDASLLPYVSVVVTGSNLRSSERGKEIASFFIAVDVKPAQGRLLQHGSWRIEKAYSEILTLDARLKQRHGKSFIKRMAGVELPDSTLFKDHAPSKVDKRKSMLKLYLKTLLSIPLSDKADLCTFLCTDIVAPKVYDPYALTKEGLLTKKGQNLGRWVTRWYVLSDTSLSNYESRGGLHLGNINIRGAQIGRQQKSANADVDENSYRHAFLILEAKAANNPSEQRQVVRHVLCAESDEERDEWVDVLVRAIAEAENREQTQGMPSVAPLNVPTMPMSPTQPLSLPDGNNNGSRISEKQSSGSSNGGHGALTNMPRSPSMMTPSSHRYGDPNIMASPAVGSSYGTIPRSRSDFAGLNPQDDRAARLHNTPQGHAGLAAITGTSQPPASQSKQLQGPSASAIRALIRSTSQDIPSSSSTGHGTNLDGSVNSHRAPSIDIGPERHSSSSGPRSMKDRIRPSISGPMNGQPIPSGYKFGGKEDAVGGTSSSGSEVKKRFWHRFGGGGSEKASPGSRKVFGVPLAESLAVSNVAEGLELPSVVYRCIEYLEHRHAATEEGIYRLSGSSAVIKTLKDRFDANGDVNLLAPSEPFYDPHAIAGLLKQYLRELPSSVLTRELHLEFMRVNDMVDRRERINELGSLVSLLPLPNYSLLRTLCSHLIKVIEMSDVNKMTMRNVGIVFSPTLGIPAGVFALFLTEFDWVFYTDAHGEPAPRTMEEDIIPPDEAELGPEGGSSSDPPVQQQADNYGSPVLGAQRRLKRQSQLIRNNRNSLCYNDIEADRLLGGPQARNRLSAYEEDFDPSVDVSAVAEAGESEEDQSNDESNERYESQGPSLDDHHGRALSQVAAA